MVYSCLPLPLPVKGSDFFGHPLARAEAGAMGESWLEYGGAFDDPVTWGELAWYAIASGVLWWWCRWGSKD
jgi:hypothetical protein